MILEEIMAHDTTIVDAPHPGRINAHMTCRYWARQAAGNQPNFHNSYGATLSRSTITAPMIRTLAVSLALRT